MLRRGGLCFRLRRRLFTLGCGCTLRLGRPRRARRLASRRKRFQVFRQFFQDGFSLLRRGGRRFNGKGFRGRALRCFVLRRCGPRGRALGLPALRRPTLRRPMLRGCGPRGRALWLPALRGRALRCFVLRRCGPRGRALGLPALRRLTLRRPMLRGCGPRGRALWLPAFRGRALRCFVLRRCGPRGRALWLPALRGRALRCFVLRRCGPRGRALGLPALRRLTLRRPMLRGRGLGGPSLRRPTRGGLGHGGLGREAGTRAPRRPPIKGLRLGRTEGGSLELWLRIRPLRTAATPARGRRGRSARGGGRPRRRSNFLLSACGKPGEALSRWLQWRIADVWRLFGNRPQLRRRVVDDHGLRGRL